MIGYLIQMWLPPQARDGHPKPRHVTGQVQRERERERERERFS